MAKKKEWHTFMTNYGSCTKHFVTNQTLNTQQQQQNKTQQPLKVIVNPGTYALTYRLEHCTSRTAVCCVTTNTTWRIFWIYIDEMFKERMSSYLTV